MTDGYNNNNYGRYINPSNMPFQSNSNNNQHGTFVPRSYNQMNSMNTRNYQANFAPNQPLISKIDYTNKQQVLHDNLDLRVLSEHLVEHKVIIDGIDRDVTIFPNPFKYTVTFNPNGNSLVGGEVFTGPPSPHVGIDFKNIKYIKVNETILPKYTHIMKRNIANSPRLAADIKVLVTAANNTHLSSTDLTAAVAEITDMSSYMLDIESTYSKLYDDRFVLLKCKELNTNLRLHTTNNIYNDCLAKLRPDKLISSYYFDTRESLSDRIFEESQLGNLKKLTFEFCDSFGVMLEYKFYDADINDDIDIDSPVSESLSTIEKIIVTVDDESVDIYATIPITDVRNPYNRYIQTEVGLSLGIVEPRINTQPKYDN